MGSGKLIRRAIKKHGIENFTKEILHVFETEEEMSLKEAELVETGPDSYNLCPGGKGGWGYVNDNRLWNTERHRLSSQKRIHKAAEAAANKFKNIDFRKKVNQDISKSMIGKQNFLGKKHSEDVKIKVGMSSQIKQKGERNSQFGTRWVTSFSGESMKIKNDEVDTYLRNGYILGRKRRELNGEAPL